MITILKEIKQLLEKILAELKKPTAVTVDSEKVTKAIKDGSLEYHDPIFKLNKK
ncbi:hypothetical protein VMHJH2_07190 [Streptococcus uberis]|uniref:hypothetical protein n=1 Tax=Streptococcus uberis TaxID=1349 RepID=UPI0021505D2D|nr:hypothetical protein [Streptococcus uberis]MCR4258299.1 hypothetical protein [Streptococcus uberis]